MYLPTNLSELDPTPYIDCLSHTNSSAIPCNLNLTSRVIKDRVEIFDHPDVENPFKSKLTTLQDDILGSYILLIGIGSLILNGFNIKICLSNSKKLKPPEIFVVNVMVCDILITISTYPLATAAFFAHGWLGGHKTCQLYGFFSYLFGYSELLNLMALALVRYAVMCCNAGIVQRQLTLVRCKFAVFGIYSLAFLMSVFPFTPWASYGPEVSGVACSLEWMLKENMAFVITMCITSFVAPMGTMVFCYSSILMLINKQRVSIGQHKQVAHNTGSEDCKPIMCAFFSMTNQSPSVSMARMTCLMWLAFLCCWGPYAVISFLIAFSDVHISPLVSIVPATITKTSVVINPIIYFMMSKQYRNRLKMGMKMGMKKCSTDATTQFHFPQNMETQL